MRVDVSGRRLRLALRSWVALGGVLVLVAVVVGTAGTSRLERTVTDFLLTATLVVALQAFVGNSGIVSFGHMAFVGIGAYAAALVTIPPILKEQTLTGLPGWLEAVELGGLPAIAVGGAAAALIAMLVGGAMARMSELGFAMATLALLVLVHAVLANWDSVTRGGYGIYGIPSNTTLWVALAGLLLAVFLSRLYRTSDPGLRLQAGREDPLSARSVGVNVAASRFGSWVFSATLMGAGGALLAQHLLAFDPDQFYFALTFSTLAMLVIGGRESVTGAVAGAALVTVVSDLLRRAERGFSVGPLDVPELPGLVQLVVATMIVLVLVFRPSGLFGRRELDEVFVGVARKLRRGGPLEDGPPEPRVQPDVPSTWPRRASATGEGAASPAVARRAPALEAEWIVMDFQGLRALDGVSLTLYDGEILGLIGPNGSGKTTLLNVVSGVFRPARGAVALHGMDVTGWPAHRVARKGLARTFQSIRLFGGLTVRENLQAAALEGTSDAEVDRLLALFDLEEHADDLAGTLAYGAQRRAEAARAAIRRPSVLLLDEPAAGMNEAESEHLLEIISRVRDELDCSVIVIDHDLRLILRLSDRVHVLNEGLTIAEGSPTEIARDPVVIDAYLGTAGTG